MPEAVTEKLKGVPISDLIAAPLQAACDAQMRLAASSIEFIQQVGFQEGDLTKPNMLEFTLARHSETATGSTKNDVKIHAPLLGLVPVPSLLIDNVQVDFQVEVTATETSTNRRTAEATAAATYKIPFIGAKINIQGKVGSSREATRSTNQTAKYQVHVSARQQQYTEGMSRLMDMLATCTSPVDQAAPAAAAPATQAAQ